MPLATDYPYPWTIVAVGPIFDTPNRSDDQPIAIPGVIATKRPRIK